MLNLLAYTPFIDPLPYHGNAGWVWLFIPLTVLVSTAYKTIKVDRLEHVPKQAATLSVQIILLMSLAAAVLWAVTEML